MNNYITILFSFFFIIFKSIVLTPLAYASLSEVKSPSFEDKAEDTLNAFPSYIHEGVQKQIQDYRRVYDAFKKTFIDTPDAPKTKYEVDELHVPGLFDIFKKGLNAAHDYLKDNPSSRTFEDNFTLETLYQETKRLNNENKFSANRFVGANRLMAVIVDRAKPYWGASIKMAFKTERFDPNTGKFKPYYLGFNEQGEMYQLSKYAKKKEEGIKLDSIAQILNFKYQKFLEVGETAVQSLKFEVNTRRGQFFYPFMFIYSNKGNYSWISMNTIVDQALHKDYGADVFLWDAGLLDLEEKQSDSQLSYSRKALPHYGSFAGTAWFLNHDLAHYTVSNRIEANWRSTGRGNSNPIKTVLKFWEDMHKVKGIKDSSAGNDKSILSNGLFILLHEPAAFLDQDYSTSFLINLEREDYIAQSNKKTLFPIEVLVSRSMKEMMNIALSTDRDALNAQSNAYEYKETFRDLESILYAKDNQGNRVSLLDFEGEPLIVSKAEFKALSPKEKNKKVAYGYYRFWQTFFSLIPSNKGRIGKKLKVNHDARSFDALKIIKNFQSIYKEALSLEGKEVDLSNLHSTFVDFLKRGRFSTPYDIDFPFTKAPEQNLVKPFSSLSKEERQGYFKTFLWAAFSPAFFEELKRMNDISDHIELVKAYAQMATECNIDAPRFDLSTALSNFGLEQGFDALKIYEEYKQEADDLH